VQCCIEPVVNPVLRTIETISMLAIEPLSAVLGTRITGINLAAPPSTSLSC
jgi:hypothetical protein